MNDEQITLAGINQNISRYWYAPQIVRGAYEFADDEQQHFFLEDYRGIALVDIVEAELKRKDPTLIYFIWGY